MILRPVDIMKACNSIVSTKYPTMKLYGKEVVDGYQKPSMFTELQMRGYTRETRNYARCSATFRITYFEETTDELDELTKVNELEEAFGAKITVKDGEDNIRKLNISSYDYDYVGEYTNILQISISFSWTEQLPRTERQEIMESVQTEIINK